MSENTGTGLPADTQAEQPQPEQESPEQESTGEESPALVLPEIGLWKWYHDQPTEEVVLERLASLPPQFGGIEIVKFADYIVPLPQTETLKIPRPGSKSTVEVEHKVTTWTLYMSVAGRIEMLEAAQAANGWRVDIVPAPGQGDLGPGFLEVGGMLVYRVQVSIWLPAPKSEHTAWRPAGTEPANVPLGTRTGQVWIPSYGPSDRGGGAKKSNPVEKAETAAIGRCLGMWGIGILPGSGVASLEEMQSLRQSMAGDLYPQEPQNVRDRQPQDKEGGVGELKELIEELRQMKALTERDFRNGIGRYFAENLGARDAVDQATAAVDYRKLSDGQRTLAINNFRQLLRDAKITAGMGSQDRED